jgi:drug/metabolite transporter (DMT)-like permease
MSGPSSRFGGSRLSAPVLGALAMAAGAFCIAINHSLIRLIHDIPSEQIAAMRFLWAIPVMLPWMLRHRGAALRTRRIGLHFGSALLTAGATGTLFYALARMPLAEATALNFTVPLFTTLIAALLLRERVDGGRWAATILGFVGVLVVLRPGFETVRPVAFMPMLAALQLAVWYLTLKRLAPTESRLTVTIYQTLFAAALLTALALPGWQHPGWQTLAATLAMGVSGSAGIFLMSWAFAAADASVVAPIDYARLPFVAIIAFLAFGERPDGMTLLGAVIITGAAIYLARREARADRRRRAAIADPVA